jgi:hypothetical protein
MMVLNQEPINKIYVPHQILRLLNFNLDNLQISILHLLHKVILPTIHNILRVKLIPMETNFPPTNLNNNNKTTDKILCCQLIMYNNLQSLPIMLENKNIILLILPSPHQQLKCLLVRVNQFKQL